MRVLAIGSDRNVFNPISESAMRQVRYAERLGDIDIIVFTRRAEPLSPKILSDAVRVYPTASFTKMLYGWDAFRAALRLPRPDVVTVQDPFEAGVAGLIISWMLKVPLHVQIHTDFLSPAFATHSLMNRIRILLAGLVIPRAARVRVVSERIRASMVGRYRQLPVITVLPIFTDVARFKNAQAGDLRKKFASHSLIFLVVSRLEREKNIECAIRAFADAAPSDAGLVVVGEGSERQALTILSARLGRSLHIFFEGQQDPAPYYALADAVLVPSKYEGYGNVIIEALAAGKPVIATPVGIAQEAGAIISSESDFARALSGWIKEGPREAVLQYVPYANFDEYREAYCVDISACVGAA